MSNVLAFIFATFFSGAVLYFIRSTYPSAHRLTVRGNRLVFLLLLVVGFFMAEFIMHFYVNCDLTQPNSVCQIGWIQAQLFQPMCKAHNGAKAGRQKMARIYIKAIVAVDMPEPKATLEKQSTKERNEQLREFAAERILDALSGAELNPSIQRINLSRPAKDSANE